LGLIVIGQKQNSWNLEMLVSGDGLACFPKPVLVCTFWLCTSLDVEAGLCNPLSKKKKVMVRFLIWKFDVVNRITLMPGFGLLNA
jgi:hypothetical protein